MTSNPLGQIPSATYIKCAYIKRWATLNCVLPTTYADTHAHTGRIHLNLKELLENVGPKGSKRRMQEIAQYEAT
jgi:hypothetical protein